MSHWSIAVHIDSVPWERISAQPAFHFVASEEGEEIKCYEIRGKLLDPLESKEFIPFSTFIKTSLLVFYYLIAFLAALFCA